MIIILDLDHTLIDSSHRQLTKADGTLDLEHWIENNTPEKIMSDSILPLGREFARQRRLPRHSSIMHIACTARVMGEADHEFLRNHGLEFDAILSRPFGCSDSDVELKERLLRAFARQIDMPYARMLAISHFWDDNEKIREHFTALGVTCYNPIKYNAINSAA